jgi:hypothetical protein
MTAVCKKALHELSFDERIAERAREARAQADLLPPGEVRDALLEKARQYEAQISMNAMLALR